jgi:hypothetical protein
VRRCGFLFLLLAATACPRPPPAPGVAPFRCVGASCTQAHPALPDDGEWECLDMAGAAVCRGGDPPAGVAPAPPDARWSCGPRTGADERICVDLRPDFPGRAAAPGWRCRYENAPQPRRLCARDTGAHNLGDACSPERPCVDGAFCNEGRCTAPALTPACWLDSDCGAGTCRFGSCRKAGS